MFVANDMWPELRGQTFLFPDVKTIRTSYPFKLLAHSVIVVIIHTVEKLRAVHVVYRENNHYEKEE